MAPSKGVLSEEKEQHQQEAVAMLLEEAPPTSTTAPRRSCFKCMLLVLLSVVAFATTYAALLGGAIASFSTRDTISFTDFEGGVSKVMQTKLGPIHGACAEGTCRWLNIPFSEPFARFRQSSLRTSSYGHGAGSGTHYGPACLQFIPSALSGVEVGRQSEDCLNLNVFTPDKASSETPLPVMVFVYGGGFLIGSSSQIAGEISRKSHGLTFAGSRLVAHGVLVVVINYRLGVFGFLQQPDGTGGANGIGDQLTALQWVNRHISAFGGDPHTVTIFGQSSGSDSVSLLSHLPKASGLFQRVIAESGVCYNSGSVFMNASEAKRAREAFLSKTGLTHQELLTMGASELRNLTMRTLDPNTEFTPLYVSGVGQPSVDWDIYPDVAARLAPLPVDLLNGFNSGEERFVPTAGIPNGALSFFTKHLGGAAQNILAQYGSQPAEVELIADACLRCQSVRYAQRVAVQARSQVHFYVYDNPHNASVHGAELPAVFGTADVAILEGTIVKTPEALVQRTQRIWTDFAKGHNISKVAPGWPQVHTESSVSAMLMGEEMSVVEISTARCAAWEAAEAAIGGLATARMCNAVMVR